jgi:hypothetical protein
MVYCTSTGRIIDGELERSRMEAAETSFKPLSSPLLEWLLATYPKAMHVFLTLREC